MEFADYTCFGIFLMAPIAFLIWWVRMRLGLDKRWFVMPADPFISRNFYFALPTAMLGLVIGLVGSVLPSLDPNANSVLVALGFLGVSFILAYLEPDWMSPAWYRWLKKEHGDILSDLAMDAHELGRQEWLARVTTQADLEQWVAEVRRKRGVYTGGS